MGKNEEMKNCPFSPSSGGEGGRRPDEGAVDRRIFDNEIDTNKTPHPSALPFEGRGDSRKITIVNRHTYDHFHFQSKH